MEQILRIAEFIIRSFIHIWPYILVTIPLAVLINLSGASKYISRVFGKNPVLSVFLATLVGAFSPFCSCGVIPVISSLLISGVPLAPVMSFWIASPSMDPEIFFLSTAAIGWKLAVWRLASTFVISLLSGYITHIATVKGYLSSDVLRTQGSAKSRITFSSIFSSLRSIISERTLTAQIITVNQTGCNRCCEVAVDYETAKCSCSSETEVAPCGCATPRNTEAKSMLKKAFGETAKATLMVAKFMGLAFLITALIKFYLPQNIISGIVSGNHTIQVILATLIGIPMYTSNITALPMVGGLLELGLNKGAALSFLIAGATTTLPAMVAVWGITKKRVFILYLSFALFGALLAGLLFNLFS